MELLTEPRLWWRWVLLTSSLYGLLNGVLDGEDISAALAAGATFFVVSIPIRAVVLSLTGHQQRWWLERGAREDDHG